MFAFVALFALLAPSVNAFFRLPCAKSILDARVDPIVSPGVASGHAHTIMGGSNIGLDSSFQDMVASNCTTCKVKDDKSAYWIPSLHYEFPNKTYASVSHGGMLVYYLQRTADNVEVEAFPDGLRMLAGNPLLRNLTGTPEANAVSWNCLDYANQTPESKGMIKTDCPDGLRAQVFFPSCWDGKNVDSDDHKSHMAYPSGVDSGSCPESHPRRLVSIFYEVYFSVDPFNKLNVGGRFVLSNGDPTGYGLHADFLDGWNKDVLSRAVAICTADSGVIEDCGVFTNEGRLYTDDEENSCTAANPNPLNEVVDGSLPFLPGCVPVTDGPAMALVSARVAGCSATGSPATPISSLVTSPSVSSVTSSSVAAIPSAVAPLSTLTPSSSAVIQTSGIAAPVPSAAVHAGNTLINEPATAAVSSPSEPSASVGASNGSGQSHHLHQGHPSGNHPQKGSSSGNHSSGSDTCRKSKKSKRSLPQYHRRHSQVY
ncbi:hypothetical protein OF83DRAFT_1293676 [Amylostereum chailletii]|nr:hypothetical protein OF83DRAFT_1293676 [Amylostereum chailletii]